MNHIEEPPDGDKLPGSRLRWLGAGIVVLMFGGLVWLAVDAGLDSGAAEGGSARGTMGFSSVESLAHPSLVEMLASADATRLGARAASAVAAAREVALPPRTDETEVCGVGRVKAGDDGQPRDLSPVRRASERLRERMLPLLLQSGDDTSRAAGLLMQALGDPSPADGMEAQATRARDELATLASVRGSPQVYAWAMRACQAQRDEGACRLLSADQWARLEPANAVAWLHVAADAQVRRDAAAVAEALYRVAHAPKSDARRGALVSVVLARVPPEADLLARTSLAVDLARLDTRAELPLVAASQHCGVNEVRDANRAQVCSGVAELLSRRGSTLAEASLGVSIGERVGWPSERVAAASEERDALSQLGTTPSATSSANPWSCSALTRTLAHLTETSRHGELATLRSALKRSNESVSVLARRFRDTQSVRVASAASAASASSP